MGIFYHMTLGQVLYFSRFVGAVHIIDKSCHKVTTSYPWMKANY